jgi:hypothetical protein
VGGLGTGATFVDIKKHGPVYFSYFCDAHNNRKHVWSVFSALSHLKDALTVKAEGGKQIFSQIANPQISTKQS